MINASGTLSHSVMWKLHRLKQVAKIDINVVNYVYIDKLM
jgi:hypothetical protein